MKFSVIMPSMLEDYPGAATQREKKLIRAVGSVLTQSFKDFELIIISDGCNLTSYIIPRMFPDEKRIKLLRVEREGLWSNEARNAGIKEAQGDYIIYCDSDDNWGNNHLKAFADNLNGEDWAYADDAIFRDGKWHPRLTDVNQYGRCGTSNICHARRLSLLWDKTGYGHDYHFIQQLIKNGKKYKKVQGGEYFVCHVGGMYQV